MERDQAVETAAVSAGIGAVAIVLIILGVIAGIVVALLAIGGVGIFAVKQTLFQVHSDVTDATQDGMMELTRGASVRVRPPTAMVLTAEQAQAAMLGTQGGLAATEVPNAHERADQWGELRTNPVAEEYDDGV